jgi:peptidoglycan/LPS O-acetylase OafA/YrhL
VVESKPVTHLGDFSYSLYLIHPVIVALILIAMRNLPLSPIVWTITMTLAGVGASLVAAQLFYWGIERYCIPSKSSKSLSTPGKKPIPQPIVAANSQAW